MLNVLIAIGLLVLGVIIGHMMSYAAMKDLGKVCSVDTRDCVRCAASAHCPIMRGRVEKNE